MSAHRRLLIAVALLTVAYFVLVAVGVRVSEQHSRADTRLSAKVAARDLAQLRKLHAEFCRSFLIVRDDTEFELETLQEWAIAFSDRTKVGLNPVPKSLTVTIRRRLEILRHQDGCTP